jgi:hypothetical protein
MKRISVLLLLALSACTTVPPSRDRLPPVVESQPSEAGQDMVPQRVEPTPVPAPAMDGGAVIALLERADSYQASGDFGAEAATVERALRIEPGNARLWNRLASVRLKQGKPRQAEQLALRSNALAGADTGLQRRNWRLVARARWAMNDSAGARSAEKRARELERHD